MPKPIRSRRFAEPRCGVSQAMIEAEATELGRELRSYLLLSLTDLRERSQERLSRYRTASESLQRRVDALPELEQRAVVAMLGRDLHLVLELYLQFLATLSPEPMVRLADPPAPPLPFSDWLFGA